MISDGCGFKHVEAADLYSYGETGRAVYEQFPCRLAMKTDSMRSGYDGPEPRGYDADAAWSDFSYVAESYTDSAAAATALFTGHKTLNGAVGVDVNGRIVRNVLERCEGLGMATGVVTSVFLCDATPAGAVTHSMTRYSHERIATWMILGSPVDCILGCGHPWYDPNGRRVEEPITFACVGGEKLWDDLVAGAAGRWDPALDDADGNGRPDPGEWLDADHNGRADDEWSLVQSREGFRKLMRGTTPKRVIGIPQVFRTLQQERDGDPDAAPYAVPLIETVPTLAEMAVAALNVLDDDPDGLFVMIEGGAVDWASHDNESGRMIEEQRDLNAAVEAVVDWVERSSNWEETILVVTADHECGYLTAGPGVWAYEPLPGNGAGKLPSMAWNSGSHTNSLVPFYARGSLASEFEGRVVGADPHFGRYIDNTGVAKVLFAALEAKAAETPHAATGAATEPRGPAPVP
jgi:alkaline phosphatase